MRVADTSALYAVFDADDAHHAASRAGMALTDTLVVPSEIFAETLALLQYRLGFEAALASGAALRQTPHVEVRPSPPEVLDSAWREYEAAEGDLSYPDAVVVAWCRASRAKPFTHDRALARRAR